MKLLGTQVYRFGDIEFDPSQGCIRLGGQEHYLRQKALQLLLYLVERRDRLVTKEELIESIWAGTAVSDDALVQLIKDVRRSLGDDPRQPQFIKTFPKVGYRFVGAVEEISPRAPAILETKEFTTIEVEYDEEIDEDSQAIATRLRPLPGPVLKRPGMRWIVLGTVSIVIAAIALTIYFRTVRHSIPQMTLPQVDGRKTVAVMHFENLSHSQDLDWMREGLADMLITNLSRSNRLTVLGRQQLHLLLERLGYDRGNEIQLGDALHIAEASGAQVVILGSVASVGQGMHISVQLYDTQGKQPMASERVEVEAQKDIITQLDLLSLKIASHLGAKEGQDSRSGLSEAMTNNLEAYRCYSLAIEKTYGLQNAEAITLLERAVSLDKQFAMAYARIGYAYAVRWSMTEQGKPYLEKAFQLSDRLTEKDRLSIAGWYSIANHDYVGAIRNFQDLVARYPLELEAYWRLSGLLQGEERHDEALDVAKRGLAVDPDSKELYNQLGFLYLDLNRFGEALEMYQRYVALAPEEPNSHDSLGLFYQAVGRYGDALESYQKAIALKPDFAVALMHLGNVFIQEGRYREAIGLYEKIAQTGPSGIEKARSYGALSEVYLRMGSIDRAEKAAELERRYGEEVRPKSSHCWHALLIAMRRGQASKVKQLEDQILSSNLSNRGARESLRFSSYHQGILALHRGQDTEAIANFKDALHHRPPYWDIDPMEDCLAKAYLNLGLLDEAIAEYDRVLNLNPNYPLAHYYLGLAFDQRGDRDRARNEFSQFLQIWDKADPDIPEIVAARKRV